MVQIDDRNAVPGDARGTIRRGIPADPSVALEWGAVELGNFLARTPGWPEPRIPFVRLRIWFADSTESMDERVGSVDGTGQNRLNRKTDFRESVRWHRNTPSPYCFPFRGCRWGWCTGQTGTCKCNRVRMFSALGREGWPGMEFSILPSLLLALCLPAVADDGNHRQRGDDDYD